MEAPLVPAWFTAQLAAEFDGQLRLRWSLRKQRWLIERRVGRVRPWTGPLDPADDRAIQARDNVQTVLEVTPGSHTPCPKCGQVTQVAFKRFEETKCSRCRATFRAVFFPLGADLLQHLRWSDPDRGGLERVFTSVDVEQEQLQRSKRSAFRTQHEAIWKEDKYRLLGIPLSGYTGKVLPGTALKNWSAR